MMEEEGKLPLRRVELSLSKFNDVAIPHHLGLLRQHRTNILKYESNGDTSALRREQTHAGRVARQLRALMSELAALRRQVIERDRDKFDSLTQRSRDLTLRAIVDYLETSPLSANGLPVTGAVGSLDSVGVVGSMDSVGVVGSVDSVGIVGSVDSAISTESVGVVGDADHQLQMRIDQESSLSRRSAVLSGWMELQRDVTALHDVWSDIQRQTNEQREQVYESAHHVEAAAVNVRGGRSALARADRARVGGWCAVGAACGLMCGGPAGLVLGVKAGAAAALAGLSLGYFGGKALARRVQQGEGEDQSGDQSHEDNKHKDINNDNNKRKDKDA